jgi:hypothetical protein
MLLRRKAENKEKLTDGGDDDHHEEGVEHGYHRGRERGEHALQLPQLPEEPDDSEGAQKAQGGNGQLYRPQRDKGKKYYQGIQNVPSVAHERRKPMSKSVDHELEEENKREKDIEVIEHCPER